MNRHSENVLNEGNEKTLDMPGITKTRWDVLA